MRKISLCINKKPSYVIIKIEEGAIKKYVSLVNPALGFHSDYTLVSDKGNATVFNLADANEFLQDHFEELGKSDKIPSYFVVRNIYDGKFLKLVHGKKGDLRIRWTSDFERVTKFETVISALRGINDVNLNPVNIAIHEVHTYLDEIYTPILNEDEDWEYK